MSERKTMIVGLTGQTGAGKSTLSRLFGEWGMEVIDADEVAREAVERSIGCLSDLVLEFSTEVIYPDATLNRARLADICFGDKTKLKRLNDITFPYIIDAIAHKLERACARGVRMVLLDAPTLYESGLDRRCDRVVAMIAPESERCARIMQRDAMTHEAAMQRIGAQNDDAFYRDRVDDVIENDGELGALRLAFIELFNRYEAIANSGDFARETPSPEPAPLPDDFDEPGTEE